jgi:hypothetical protein
MNCPPGGDRVRINGSKFEVGDVVVYLEDPACVGVVTHVAESILRSDEGCEILQGHWLFVSEKTEAKLRAFAFVDRWFIAYSDAVRCIGHIEGV